MEQWKKNANERALKHNKRVKSIRENRLPKSCVEAIDESISAMTDMQNSILEGLSCDINAIRMEDIMALGNALTKLQQEFEYKDLIEEDYNE
jgi:hypothetical protein